MRKIVSNTSCLISLNRIGKLHILKDFYGEILIPPGVKEEFGEEIEDWIIEHWGRCLKFEFFHSSSVPLDSIPLDSKHLRGQEHLTG